MDEHLESYKIELGRIKLDDGSECLVRASARRTDRGYIVCAGFDNRDPTREVLYYCWANDYEDAQIKAAELGKKFILHNARKYIV
ncbi:hypothetical protein J4229_01560 [Candidatus Pacearchaeota archaeon]|nr:hypothetical protein [Candidatus Pacearchaeota archaeon]